MATPISTDKLYDLVVETEKNLETIATELGKLGADDQAVKFFSQAADVTRRVSQSLAKNMRDEEPPVEAEGEQPAQSMDEATDRMMARRGQAAQ